eukprot:CAMPEP_0178428830 /NCGR_PEP_ID=MMETSP0689_2-20121128/30486_1 /TAXON_ID=160604 /ORGANISM="Amphidinium massartii, Strain CS-259" /LENGTH=188 /DNA_ID=CAMNT_0020050627 /DNA_START=12 /DNA_END=578 /DNA_ORIENTATION=-
MAGLAVRAQEADEPSQLSNLMEFSPAADNNEESHADLHGNEDVASSQAQAMNVLSSSDASSRRIAARRASSSGGAARQSAAVKARQSAGRSISWTFGSSHLVPNAGGNDCRQGLKHCPSSCGSLSPILEDQPMQEDSDEDKSDSRHATPMFLPGIRDHSTQIPGTVDDARGSMASRSNRPLWAFDCSS